MFRISLLSRINALKKNMGHDPMIKKRRFRILSPEKRPCVSQSLFVWQVNLFCLEDHQKITIDIDANPHDKEKKWMKLDGEGGGQNTPCKAKFSEKCPSSTNNNTAIIKLKLTVDQ